MESKQSTTIPQAESTNMKARPNLSSAKPRPTSGFSLLELVVVTAVIFTLLGVGLPFFTQAYRDYQLNDAATQVAGVLKAARFEAIRRNVAVNCVIAQGGAPVVTNMWVDSNGDGNANPAERNPYSGGGRDRSQHRSFGCRCGSRRPDSDSPGGRSDHL